MKRLLLLSLIGALAVLALWQWERIQVASLREGNLHLMELEQEADRLRRENAALDQIPDIPQPPEFPREELLQLRGEVARARAHPPDLNQMRHQNQSLAAKIRAAAEKSDDFSKLEGYVPRSAWVDSGFASPEAAVQTLYAAMSRGDLEGVLRCHADEEALDLRTQMERAHREGRQLEGREVMRRMTMKEGYRITGKQFLADDRVALGLQATAHGAEMEMVLQKAQGEWKVLQLLRLPR